MVGVLFPYPAESYDGVEVDEGKLSFNAEEEHVHGASQESGDILKSKVHSDEAV